MLPHYGIGVLSFYDNMLEDVLRSLVFYLTIVLQRRKRDGGTSAIIGAAASAAIAGASVASATASFNGLDFNVKMQMDIGKCRKNKHL